MHLEFNLSCLVPDILHVLADGGRVLQSIQDVGRLIRTVGVRVDPLLCQELHHAILHFLEDLCAILVQWRKRWVLPRTLGASLLFRRRPHGWIEGCTGSTPYKKLSRAYAFGQITVDVLIKARVGNGCVRLGYTALSVKKLEE